MRAKRCPVCQVGPIRSLGQHFRFRHGGLARYLRLHPPRCEGCGQTIRPPPSAPNDATYGLRRRFCSQTCNGHAKEGAAHPMWRGGSIVSKGYRMLYIGRGRYRFEHRIVMERQLGRPLKRDEHVHHINGDKLDNRTENLAVMSNSEHRKLHTPEHFVTTAARKAGWRKRRLARRN